mgnify:CR=1 FL=1
MVIDRRGALSQCNADRIENQIVMGIIIISKTARIWVMTWFGYWREHEPVMTHAVPGEQLPQRAVDDVLQLPPEIECPGRHQLGHKNDHQFLHRVHPEQGAGQAAPEKAAG